MFEDAKYLTENEKKALAEIKRRVSALFPIQQYILFGSKARGDAAPDSDVDLLMVTQRELTHKERHVISNELFEINIKWDTLFSFISVDDATWSSKLYRFYPIHVNVEREGILV